jgi:two-component system CheB/CheR fusion protein
MPQGASQVINFGRHAMRHARVLVVEDCPDTAATLAFLLRHWGHETCEVHNGKEAVDAARQFDPDAAILDIGLPNLDGFAVAKEMRRSENRKLLLVALTGFAQEEYRQRSYRAGFDHYLVKPVAPDTLKALLVCD